jgi:hypothetical protein
MVRKSVAGLVLALASPNTASFATPALCVNDPARPWAKYNSGIERVGEFTLGTPEAGRVSEAELGQAVVSSGQALVFLESVNLIRPIDYTGSQDGSGFKIHIPAGMIAAESNTKEMGYYVSQLGTYMSDKPGKSDTITKVGVAIAPESNGKLQVYWWRGSKVKLYDIADVDFTKVNCFRNAQGAFRRELLYSGISKGTISLQYREFSDDMARPAFSQDLHYDLADGDEIGFKGARIQIIKATNVSVKFKVIKPLE